MAKNESEQSHISYIKRNKTRKNDEHNLKFI